MRQAKKENVQMKETRLQEQSTYKLQYKVKKGVTPGGDEESPKHTRQS